MALRTKTIEYAFDTRLTTLATGTTLAAATRHDFTAITVYIPETTDRTFRSVVVVVTARDAATTTARRIDGCRIGMKLGAAAFTDLDLTGTGITNTGDPFSVIYTHDATSYFTSNFGSTGSQTAQVGVAFEEDVADIVNNITAKLIITYEYNDSDTTRVKTVRIPLEGVTGFLGTTANTNIRGSTGAAQIPNLDTFLPESSKTYRNIWFECYATDGGAATTDFNAVYAIDSGTNTRATLEEGLNGSAYFYDIFVQNSMTTNGTHDFQAWSSLASRFERFCVILHVTYEYASSSSTIINSLLIPIDTEPMTTAGTTSGDQEFYENSFYIHEPATVTMVQSGVLLFWSNGAAGNLTVAVSGSGAAGGAQGTTTSTYTGTSLVESGVHPLCHRIDVAHGGSAITLGRGKNTLGLKVYASANNVISGLNGFYIINYTSGKQGDDAKHNHTTIWCIQPNMAGTIAGSAYQEIATTNQRTPNIPETSYFSRGNGFLITGNKSANGAMSLRAEILSGEFLADGWVTIDVLGATADGEFGIHIGVASGGPTIWEQHPNDSYQGDKLAIEQARKYRLEGVLGQWTILRVLNYHSLTSTFSGTISGYTGDGSGITVKIWRVSTGEQVGAVTSTTGGNYTFTWYGDTEQLVATAEQDSTHVGASVAATATLD